MAHKKTTRRERLSIENLERREMMVANFGFASMPVNDGGLAYIANPIATSQYNPGLWMSHNQGASFNNLSPPLYNPFAYVGGQTVVRPDQFRLGMYQGLIGTAYTATGQYLPALMHFGTGIYNMGNSYQDDAAIRHTIPTWLASQLYSRITTPPTQASFSYNTGTPSAATYWLNPAESTRFNALDSYFNNLGSTSKTSSGVSFGYNENATRINPIKVPTQRSSLVVTPVPRYNPNASPFANVFATKPTGSYTVPPLIPRW
jgi:hypothetical protein